MPERNTTPLHKRKYLGGERARKWRRTVAAQHESKVLDTTYTFKFPLELPERAEEKVDFEEAIRCYNVVEGVGLGSLLGLLCSVHLSGFRLFNSSISRETFMTSDREQEENFTKHLKDELGDDFSQSMRKRNPMRALREFVKKSRNVKNNSFKQLVIAELLYKDMKGTVLEDGKKKQKHLWEMCEGIAEELKGEFPTAETFEDMNKDTDSALTAMDRHLSSRGFPGLRSSANPTATLPDVLESSTICFDKNAPYYNMPDDSSEAMLHMAVAFVLSLIRKDGEEPEATALKDRFLGRNGNQPDGISWLFGSRGLGYIKSASVEQICKDYGISSDRAESAEQLKRFADAIPDKPFFHDGKHYAKFRKSVSKKISSWLTSYWDRLKELREIFEKLGEDENFELTGLPDDQRIEPTLRYYGTSQNELKSFLGLVQSTNVETARTSLQTLSGETDAAETYDTYIEHIKTLERVGGAMSNFLATLNSINNEAKQRKNNTDDKEEKKFWRSVKLKVESGSEVEFKKPPRLNRISGGVPDVRKETQLMSEQLNELILAQETHFAEIKDWAQGEGIDIDDLRVIMEVIIKREEEKLEDKGDTKTDHEIQGYRYLVDRIGKEARSLSKDNMRLLQELIQPIFASKKDSNKYFANQQGFLYKSPYSNSRHQAYNLKPEELKGRDWLSEAEEVAKKILNKLDRGENIAENLRDWLNLRSLCYITRLAGLPQDVQIPSDVARFRGDEDLARIPPMLALQLQNNKTVSRDVCIRLFNLYSPALIGFAFKMLRKQFILRTAFQIKDDNELRYVAKPRPWKSPPHLSNTRKPISRIIKTAEHVDGERIDSLQTIKKYAKDPDKKYAKDSEELRAFMGQAPHDWFYPVTFGIDIPKTAGVIYEKGNIKFPQNTNTKTKPALRLRGPSRYKGYLVKALNRKMSFSGVSLILERSFEQDIHWTGGKMEVNVREKSLSAYLAVPFKYTGDVSVDDLGTKNGELFDKVIGVDLGEHSIGYAVFSIPDFLEDTSDGLPKPLKVGTVTVPSIRGLHAKVKQLRGRMQPRQRMQDSYSHAVAKYRSNAVGDVCNRIENLCSLYNAFPVLESSIQNLESGGKQLKTIYGSVVRMYVFSKVQDHKDQREQRWGGTGWKHPYMSLKKDEKDEKDEREKRSLFPGRSVSAYNTSRICSECGHNALEALKSYGEKEQLEVKKDERGRSVVRLEKGEDRNKGTIIVRHKNTQEKPAERRKRRSRKQNTQPADYPFLRPGMYDARDILDRVKYHLRHSPLSMQSPDTTQSQFLCPYDDCPTDNRSGRRQSKHADENAAINIGRRFLRDRVEKEKSLKAWEDYRQKGRD